MIKESISIPSRAIGASFFIAGSGQGIDLFVALLSLLIGVILFSSESEPVKGDKKLVQERVEKIEQTEDGKEVLTRTETTLKKEEEKKTAKEASE